MVRPPQIPLLRRTKEASTNTDSPPQTRLYVSDHPRQVLNHAVSHSDLHVPYIRQSPRMGGLTNAFSSIDIASSTHLDTVRRGAVSRLKVRRQPVKRAASRLYRSGSIPGKKDDVCIGPEFIVRATHPSKQLELVPSTV